MAEKLFPCGKDLSRSTTRRGANVQELVESRVLLLAVKSYCKCPPTGVGGEPTMGHVQWFYWMSLCPV